MALGPDEEVVALDVGEDEVALVERALGEALGGDGLILAVVERDEEALLATVADLVGGHELAGVDGGDEAAEAGADVELATLVLGGDGGTEVDTAALVTRLARLLYIDLHMTEADEIGDLLRTFYAKFGMPNEGPPPGVNVTSVIGATIPTTDLEFLQNAISDDDGYQQAQKCRSLLDELARRLTGDELLRELSQTSIASAHNIEKLASGVLWFALAGSLDSRQHGLPVTPLEAIVDLPLPIKVRMSIHGSLVLRLYVALVYMREGCLADLIDESSRARGPCSNKVKKLLNSNYVRHIRNALSHGSFSPCVAGIVFRDERCVLVATPGFLDWLCTWLMLIQVQALAACNRSRGTTP